MKDSRFCSWVDCKREWTMPQVDAHGRYWARLCDEHDEAFNNAIAALDVKKMLSFWVKAQGDAKEAARRT